MRYESANEKQWYRWHPEMIRRIIDYICTVGDIGNSFSFLS